MTEIIMRSDMDVEYMDGFGSDETICRAARVSTVGAASWGTDESEGLIKFLVKNRHGSPFEANSMMFRIKAPIFVWREFMRHRIGWSYSEQSARYMELAPEFYIPNAERPLVQVGKAGAYEFVPGDENQQKTVQYYLKSSYGHAWESYQMQLSHNIAKEVARMCLPVATYSSAYVTCNARSLMAFLSLRTKDEKSTFPSYPQAEIAMVANQMEAIFADKFPLTRKAFHSSGRVSP